MEPITVINRFQIQPGKMDEFIASQRTFANELSRTPCGLIGGRMYRSVDDRSAVLVSVFASATDRDALAKTEAFKQHLASLKSMVESSTPSLYEPAYTTGEFR